MRLLASRLAFLSPHAQFRTSHPLIASFRISCAISSKYYSSDTSLSSTTMTIPQLGPDWRYASGDASVPPFHAFAKPIVKSQQDDRDYRLIKLENGLQAMLIHDPKADKAAASMDVAVGHLFDPVSHPTFCNLSLANVRHRMICQVLLTSASTSSSWWGHHRHRYQSIADRLLQGTEQFPKENEYTEVSPHSTPTLDTFSNISLHTSVLIEEQRLFECLYWNIKHELFLQCRNSSTSRSPCSVLRVLPFSTFLSFMHVTRIERGRFRAQEEPPE